MESFQAFILEHKDEIDALQVLYTRPYGKRLTRKEIKELADAIKRPPRTWTTEQLWAAHETVEKSRVRGASSGNLWTDIVSLARHALHPEEDIVPFADQVREQFENWLAQQGNRGRKFTPDQLHWLTLIRDRIAGDAEVRLDDFDDVFVGASGLGKFYAAYGEGYEDVLIAVNAELVA